MNPKLVRAWQWAGTPAANRVLFFGLCLYLIALGFLYGKQTSIVRCQAEYASASAKSTQARAAIAAEDRRLTAAETVAAEAAETSMDKLLNAMKNQPATGAAPVNAAFTELLRVRAVAADVRAFNKTERTRLEEERKKNPPADPPETFC